MNTYGLFSIHNHSFNNHCLSADSCERIPRNLLVIFFKIHNFTLNLFGYLPQTGSYSGLVRIASGFMLLMAGGMPPNEGFNEKRNAFFTGHFYYEIIATAITQIFRGMIETLCPKARIINACFDLAATYLNIKKINPLIFLLLQCNPEISRSTAKVNTYPANQLHEDPVFPWIFTGLKLI